MLIKGGYLDPQEALFGQQDSLEKRMKRASSVFYDLALNFNPELLSPQYNVFYDAASHASNKATTFDQTTDTVPNNYKNITLG